jgi:hypothetical protein
MIDPVFNFQNPNSIPALKHTGVIFCTRNI